MKIPGFIGGSAVAQSPNFSVERSINFYTELADSPSAAAQKALWPTPGVSLFAAGPEVPVRALFAQNDALYGVFGTTFGLVASDGTVTQPSTTVTLAAITATEPATIVSNGDPGGQLLICSGETLYLYTISTDTLIDLMAAPTSLGFKAHAIAHLDGYFLALDSSTSQVYQSNLYDGATWDALAFERRSKAGDRWQTMLANGGDLWLFGSETSEVWYNAGTIPFAFSPHPSGVIPSGVAAKASVASLGGVVFWLEQTANGRGRVVMAQGYAPQGISTKALEWAIANYETIDDAVGACHVWLGHPFYVLTFPSANATWVFDLSTGDWHERGTWNSGTGTYDAWRPLYVAQAFDTTLIGDRAEGNIYQLRHDVHTDVDGVAIRRVRRGPCLSDDGRRLFFPRFQLDLEPGLGTASGDGADPDVTLNYSNDAGKTWKVAGNRSAGSGPLGEYSKRVCWNRLGSARNRVFEVVMSDPIPWRIWSASIKVEPEDGA